MSSASPSRSRKCSWKARGQLVFDSSPMRSPRARSCLEHVGGVGFVADVRRPSVEMMGRRLLDHRVGDVEPELDGCGLEDLGQAPALEGRGRPLPEPLVDGGERGDEVVLTSRIETVRGETPQVQQVGPTEVPRRQGPTPVEDHCLHHHGPDNVPGQPVGPDGVEQSGRQARRKRVWTSPVLRCPP